jgi:hypothetical protein
MNVRIVKAAEERCYSSTAPGGASSRLVIEEQVQNGLDVLQFLVRSKFTDLIHWEAGNTFIMPFKSEMLNI